MKTAPIHSTQFTPVIDASNTTPIVITTPVPHDLRTGDDVRVNGVKGNTAANGVQFNVASRSTSPLQTVTVLSITTFSLDGSAGNGTYVLGSGDVDLRPADRFYPADTLETGDPVDFREVPYGSLLTFSAEAADLPTGVVVTRVTIVLRGKYWFNSDWHTVATINGMASTWESGFDGPIRFLTEFRDLNSYPFMRIDVIPEVGSNNIVRAWITI